MALKYLLDLIATFLVAIFVLRFLMQLTRADFYNPISQAIVKMTNPLVLPLRRIVPGWGGLDNASLVAAVLVQVAVIILLSLIFSGFQVMPGLAYVLLMTPFKLTLLVLKIYTVLIFLRVLMSWVNPDPRHPMVSILYSITEPVLRPARRLIPVLGGFDLSPILVLIALQVLSMFVEYDLLPLLLG